MMMMTARGIAVRSMWRAIAGRLVDGSPGGSRERDGGDLVAARARKPRFEGGPVEAATRRDLSRMPKNLAESSLGASAIALARELDSPTSATSKSMCANAHLGLMDRLRELAPPVEQPKDGLDEISARRVRRLAASGGAAGADS
jgi:hypothetical protein